MNSERVKVTVRGAVQGVGFRPFVYRLATELGLTGWVLNSSQGVFIEVEGGRAALDDFLLRLERQRPPLAIIQSLEFSRLDAVGYGNFEIRFSTESGQKTTLILPDIATCADCRREIFDSRNRRYLYPFTNCTNCGPRFTIIESLPYDRPHTTMKKFALCPACDAEYHDPRNRRFHAQPNACPDCGPHLELWDPSSQLLADRHDALREAVEVIRSGRILALKGIGGFQLIVDARQDNAVQRLRERKHRGEKPLALMYPSLPEVRNDCHVDGFEERLLQSPESPIVLLARRSSTSVAPSVAPGNPSLGVMLPYTPLHHILMHKLAGPIVATSGNLSDEPICIDEHEAVARLQGIADAFLVHNRPIVRQVDDSVVRVMLGRELILRRARGYAPLPIHLTEPVPSLLAVGAHLKNTVAVSVGRDVFLSQHIGDLETTPAYAAFRKICTDWRQLYELAPEQIVCDQHPEYLSTKFAREMREPRLEIQHHYAHVAACMAENELSAPVLGVAWDGTGLGTDGTIWGGEFLLVNETSFQRVAHLRPFTLPGGETAVRQPRRSALGVLYEIFGVAAFDRPDLNFSKSELTVLRQMLSRGVNSPVTTSAGRLFDAVASLIGLRQIANFEGQAAMELEFAVQPGVTESYPVTVHDIVDWQPAIRALLEDDASPGIKAAKFHNTLVEAIVEVAHRIGEPKVALTGGCFQNKYLTERAVQRLRAEGFQPYWHQRVPPNDGGIALGQIVAAARARRTQAKATEACVA